MPVIAMMVASLRATADRREGGSFRYRWANVFTCRSENVPSRNSVTWVPLVGTNRVLLHAPLGMRIGGTAAHPPQTSRTFPGEPPSWVLLCVEVETLGSNSNADLTRFVLSFLFHTADPRLGRSGTFLPSHSPSVTLPAYLLTVYQLQIAPCLFSEEYRFSSNRFLKGVHGYVCDTPVSHSQLQFSIILNLFAV